MAAFFLIGLWIGREKGKDDVLFGAIEVES